jgi:hypothetical protein
VSPLLDGFAALLPKPERPLRVLDFDFESKPLWFWYEKPTAVLTSLSTMWIIGGEIDHDTLTTEVAPLGSPEEYAAWLDHIVGRLTSADVLTGHNIDEFDLPLLQAQLLRLGMPGLPAMMTSDTKLLPKRRDMSASQENLINYSGLKAVCPIGMPIYKDHLSIAEWERAALGWDDSVLIERPSSDVHGHAHLRETLIAKGYLGSPRRWRPGGMRSAGGV